MSNPIFTKIDYEKIHEEQIAIEREMDALQMAGLDDPVRAGKHRGLYDKWLNLEYIANA